MTTQKKAEELEKRSKDWAGADQYAAAIVAAEELLALRTKVQEARPPSIS